MLNLTKRELAGQEVTLLGFGCMRLPKAADGKIDRVLAAKMLDYAFESGVNYYDTAYMYHDGESELFLGEYLKKHDRASFNLATKLPCWDIKTIDDAKRLFEDQRRKLQVEYFDYYLLHCMNTQLFDKVLKLGIIDLMEEYKKQGMIRHFGFSFHDGYESFERIIKAHNWDFCQIQYNYMDQEEQAGNKGYELAKSLGIPVIVMEPVKGGSLAKLPEDIEEMFKEIDPEKSIAAHALTWVATHDNIKLVLSGMTTMEQVVDNINTFTEFKPYTDAEMEKVQDIAEKIRAKVANPCTGCRYCVPCPQEVAIPYIFKVWNQYRMYQNAGGARWDWSQLAEAKKPSNCIECGRCESLCPQKISIIDNLKQAALELGNL
ncbi:MAG: aldo/keto reductase [Lachnospiraceae bacterium]|nr:aldo/keto reductase [Lachnospiraceae bacterium]